MFQSGHEGDSKEPTPCANLTTFSLGGEKLFWAFSYPRKRNSPHSRSSCPYYPQPHICHSHQSCPPPLFASSLASSHYKYKYYNRPWYLIEIVVPWRSPSGGNTLGLLELPCSPMYIWIFHHGFDTSCQFVPFSSTYAFCPLVPQLSLRRSGTGDGNDVPRSSRMDL